MQEEKHITASIVVYKEDPAQLQKIIDAFLEHPSSRKIYIVDNSPTAFLKEKIYGDRMVYLFSGSNLGFGKGHNTIMTLTKA